MDFMRGLQINRKGHDSLFVIVDRFNKVCVLMSYKRTINKVRSSKLVVWVGMGALWDTEEN